MQIVNVFVCRSASRSVFATGVLGNPLILWGVALEIALVLAIDYTPWGNLLLGTSPVVGPVWLLIILFAAAMLALEELRKWLVRGPLAKGALIRGTQ
jgi:magnesium-transporting ATPase (P-type)